MFTFFIMALGVMTMVYTIRHFHEIKKKNATLNQIEVDLKRKGLPNHERHQRVQYAKEHYKTGKDGHIDKHLLMYVIGDQFDE